MYEPIRLLYMEDDVGLGRLMQRRLEREGFRVTLAQDGNEGLRLYAEGEFDVVAVDHGMPGREGVEVIRAMAADGTPPPTVVVTGNGDELVAVEAMKLGARDYIVKDVGGNYLDLVPSVLRRALEQHRLAEAKREAEEEREALIAELQSALTQVRTLSGLLPICSACKKIRDDDGYWNQLESYISKRSDARFSHGICPECVKVFYPQTTSAQAYLSKEDLVQPVLLCIRLREAVDPVSRYLRNHFSDETQRLLDAYGGVGALPDRLLQALVDELNRLLDDEGLHDEELFGAEALAIALPEGMTEESTETNIVRRNRRLLEAAYPNEIRQSASRTG